MRRSVSALVAILALLLAPLAAQAQLPTPARADVEVPLGGLSPLGPYLWYLREGLVLPLRDADGIPMIDYGPPIGIQYNPTVVSQWGLEQHALYLATGDPAYAQNMIKAADWHTATQTTAGTWLYLFDFYHPLYDRTFRAPWISAIAQGTGLSLLARAYQHTGNPAYLAAAQRALLPFSRAVEEGGILRFYQGHPFYEEYPLVGESTLVLNGFYFSLFGLHDLWRVSGDATAHALYAAGEESAATLLPLYILYNNYSAYDLAHLTMGRNPPNISGRHYHAIVIRQSHYLAMLTGRTAYTDIAALWQTHATMRDKDNEPPRGSLLINGGAERTVSLTVTLTCAATDNMTLTHTLVSDWLDARVAWHALPCTNTIPWVLPAGDGLKTVYVCYLDSTGLPSPVYSATILLESATPTARLWLPLLWR